MNRIPAQEIAPPMLAPTPPLIRIAVVTTAAPPSANGQARVLGQILAPGALAEPVYFTDQMNIVELEQRHFGRHVALASPLFQLTARRWGRLLGGLNRSGGLARSVLIRAGEIVEALRTSPVDLVIGCSGNPFDLPATCLAARRLGLPFVAYLFDDPVYQWERGIYRSLARLSERLWSRGAAAVIVPNEVLAREVRQRLSGATVSIVRNPVDPAFMAAVEAPRQDDFSLDGRACHLLYTGSVYSAQASAFRNLVEALDRLHGRFTLDIFTAQHASDLVRRDLGSPYVTAHPHASHAESIAHQRAADVLFLPLAFDSPIPEVIQSSAPAKLGEYLASGRPILVHAPKGSFVSELIRDADAGIVVDTPDPNLLADALQRIAADAGLRTRIVANATALSGEFLVERARNDFVAVLTSVLH